MGRRRKQIEVTKELPDGSVQVSKRWVLVQHKQSDATLDRVKAEADYIFATYGMITEGIDIPRLDAGLDATPLGKATQITGRIRRPMPGKAMPIWITLRDLMCAKSMKWFDKRCRGLPRYRCGGSRVWDASECI